MGQGQKIAVVKWSRPFFGQSKILTTVTALDTAPMEVTLPPLTSYCVIGPHLHKLKAQLYSRLSKPKMYVHVHVHMILVTLCHICILYAHTYLTTFTWCMKKWLIVQARTWVAQCHSLTFIPKSTHAAAEDDFHEVYHELENIKARYYHLGIALGLPPGELEAIRKAHSQDMEVALTQVLLLWLRQQYNIEKFGCPTWQKLRKAVDGENHTLAEKIAEKYCMYHHSNLSSPLLSLSLSLSFSLSLLLRCLSNSTIMTHNYAYQWCSLLL